MLAPAQDGSGHTAVLNQLERQKTMLAFGFSVLAKDKIPDESIYAYSLEKYRLCNEDVYSGDKEVCGTNVVSLFTTLLRYDPPVYLKVILPGCAHH